MDMRKLEGSWLNLQGRYRTTDSVDNQAQRCSGCHADTAHRCSEDLGKKGRRTQEAGHHNSNYKNNHRFFFNFALVFLVISEVRHKNPPCGEH